MFFSSTPPDTAPEAVPDGSRYVLAAVIIPLVLICLFGGFQFLPGGKPDGPWSWTRFLKLDPSDDTCALINYGIVACAAIVGMGAGMKLGGEHFPGRLIAGSIMSFCLAMLANGVYTQFKGATTRAVAKAVGGPEPEDEDDGSEHKDYSPDEDDEDDDDEAPDALADIAVGQYDSDGPPGPRGPRMEIPVEGGTYESRIDPGSAAIGKGLGDACITGCSLVNRY